MQTGTLATTDAYSQVKKFIMSNSSISTAVCTLLEECEENQLIAVEREYLINSYNDKYCLNQSFPHGQIKMRGINKFFEERKTKMRPIWEEENRKMFEHLNL